MTTIELTEDHIENLTGGAQQFGRCSMLVESSEGEIVCVVVTDNHRRGRPSKPRSQRTAPASAAPADDGK